FVCGGLTTCCTSCCGVVTVRRKLRACAGRHLPNAPRSNPPPPPPPPSRPPPPPPVGVVEPPFWLWSVWMQARLLSCPACEDWKRTRPVTVRRWPPVFSFATIFGTVPDWCTAERTSPDE